MSAPPTQLPPEIERMFARKPGTEELVHGSPEGESRVGMLLKRTWLAKPDGLWELAEGEDVEPLCCHELPWYEVEPPEVAPLAYDDDTAAFRKATDVVVQGSAHTYGTPRSETGVRVTIGAFERTIRVVGDRSLEWLNGAARFGEPEPFESLPIRYDRAYGGFDATAHARFPDPMLEAFARIRPEWGLECATDFHYPRNPAGAGFLIHLDEESVAGARVPNLEYPEDPLTPERLAVGAPTAWPAGPLPAGMDWQDPSWFPRCAYLGTAGPPEHAGPVAEIERGWGAPDLFEIPLLTQSVALRSEFAQAASPGMSFPQLPLDVPFQLENLHPEQPRWLFQLPAERPAVALDLGGVGMTPLTTQLNSVVVRPDEGELVMVWCAHAPSDRRIAPDEADDLRRVVRWQRAR